MSDMAFNNICLLYTSFGLPAKYVFHAVCPAWHGGGFGEAEQLASAYHSALKLAAEYHCESVAFPLLSSGNYGYPKEQAFRIDVYKRQAVYQPAQALCTGGRLLCVSL